jgi:HAD superfamily hydrolase (TIGR01509 family)
MVVESSELDKPATRIKAVLFDLDGTLLDTEALSDKAILEVLGPSLVPARVWKECQEDNVRMPWELKKQLLGLRGSEWAPKVIKYAHEKWNVPLDDTRTAMTVQGLWNGWEEALNRLCEEVEACPGAAELVTQLARVGLPMALATSSRQSAVDKKRKRHGTMFQHIQAIVPGDHPAVQNGKPAPDVYLEAARQLGMDPTECLVFEDALSGVRSGKAAGCTVVAVPDPRFSSEEKQAFQDEADVVVSSLWDFDGRRWGIDVNLAKRTAG